MKADQLLQLSELFYSIQGESTYAGYPCVFIRLAGCNLRCTYCDARYTYEEPAFERSIDELLTYTATHPAALVELTGGEPLLQDGVYPLMRRLLDAGRTVLLETNGSKDLAGVPAGVIKIMDVKCPDSGMHDRLLVSNLEYLTSNDEIKFVISSRQDYDWTKSFIHDHQLLGRQILLISPVPGRLEAAVVAEWLLEDGLPLKLQPQLHKILWPDKARGA